MTTELAVMGELVEDRPITPTTAPSADGTAALVLPAEQAYVTETATGLVFRDDTPIGLWGVLVERLTRQHRRIEWALGDALQFGERRYGDTYAQWADETGLAENTLATIKWVAGKIERSRRREDLGWSHHREVAGLDDPAVQDRLLERAAEQGMTRWEVRRAVKVEQERSGGRAVDATGAEPEAEAHLPRSVADLTDEARSALEYRLAGIGARYRAGYERGFVDALAWLDADGCFV